MELFELAIFASDIFHFNLNLWSKDFIKHCRYLRKNENRFKWKLSPAIALHKQVLSFTVIINIREYAYLMNKSLKNSYLKTWKFISFYKLKKKQKNRFMI